MSRYRTVTDWLIRWAPGSIAGVYATVALSRPLPWLWPLLVAESVSVAIACLLIIGRWRSLEPWDSLGFTSFREYLTYQSGSRGKPKGFLLATWAVPTLLYIFMAPLKPSAFFAIIGAVALSAGVASARQRWPIDALEKPGDR